jgi:hypothetical protein
VGRDWFDGSDYPISVAADEDPWERVLVDEEKTDRIIEASQQFVSRLTFIL